MRMRLKGCRRCGGDLMPDRSDREGLTMACLQCGLEVRLRPVSRSFTLTRLRPAAAASQPRAA
ncbi:MAG: hypothetical protein HY873_09375 [Chloroflexi bacterium]|nr:hypothetical protein [Chloroflexota bacterium]